MTNTASETSTQVASKPEVDSDDRIKEMIRDARDILKQVDDAIDEIDRAAGEIDDCMTELSLLDGFPEDAEQLADALRCTDLTDDLVRSVTALRNEIIAAAKEDEDDEGTVS